MITPYEYQKYLIDEETFAGVLSDGSLAGQELYLSIDLETMNKRGPGFLSCGICPFSAKEGVVLPQLGIKVAADIGSLLACTKADPETLRWWMTEPSQEARDALFGKVLRDARGKCTYNSTGIVTYHDAVAIIHQYIEALRHAGVTIRPMGNGDIFDVGKLEASFEQFDLPITYQFWKIVDLRRLLEDTMLVTGVDVKKTTPRAGTHHDCFDDAVHQASMAVRAYDLLIMARDGFKLAQAAKGDNNGA